MKLDFHENDEGLWLCTPASNGAILATGKTREACEQNLCNTIREQIGFGPLHDSAPLLLKTLRSVQKWLERATEGDDYLNGDEPGQRGNGWDDADYLLTCVRGAIASTETEIGPLNLWAKCGECRHTWAIAKCPGPMDIVIAQIGVSPACPTCGSESVLMAKQDSGFLKEPPSP